MNLTDNRDELIQYADNVWLTRPQPFRSDTKDQPIRVYVSSDDGTLCGISSLWLEQSGIYYLGNKEMGKWDDPSFHKYIDKLTGLERAAPKPAKPIVHVIDDELFDRVCESYGNTASIKKTAQSTGMSEQKARKILITRGKYTCEVHKNIVRMLADNKSIEQIGEALGISRAQVTSYLPYSE